MDIFELLVVWLILWILVRLISDAMVVKVILAAALVLVVLAIGCHIDIGHHGIGLH